MSSKLLEIKNLGLAGINSDITPWDLGPEYVTYGINLRIRNDHIQPAFGSAPLIDAPPNGPVDAGLLKHVRVKTGDWWVQAGRKAIYAAASSNWWDSSVPGYSIPAEGQYQWTIDQLGQIVVVNNVYTTPQYYGISGTGILEDLPFDVNNTWKDLGLTCKSMRVHKNFLVAMNLSGDEVIPNGYRISHPAEANAIPFTWDTLDRSSVAIQAQLGGDGAEIMDGRSLRDSFVLYSRGSIDVLDFNPSSEFYWSRRELTSAVGALSQHCITEVKGQHFLIVDGDIVVNDGSNITSILHGKLINRFNSKTNEETQHRSFVARNDSLKEIWFCIPETGSEFPTTAYVYNWKEDTWAIRDLPTETVSADFGYNPITREEDPTLGTWAEAEGSWSNQLGVWGTVTTTALNDILCGLNASGELYKLDPGGDVQESDFNMVIERTDYPLEGHRQTNMVTRVYPHASGGEFIIQLGSQQHAGGHVSWESERVFKPGDDRKIDLRTTGEMLCWRIKSIGTIRFKLSGLTLEYVNAGTR